MVESKSEKRIRFLAHCVLMIFAVCAVIPFLIMLCSSFSDEKQILQYGYFILPRGFSLEAYEYIFSAASSIWNAYKVTILVTVFGTAVSLILTSMAGYVLSKRNLPGRKLLMFLVIFTMLFNGGLVPTYYVYTQILNVKDTLLALILPSLLISPFNIILVRNYHVSSVPGEIYESAEIDGASTMQAFIKIALPLALPITATIGLLTAIAYWNDWQNGLYYISDNRYFSIQQVLREFMSKVSFFTSAMNGASKGIDRELPTATLRMAVAVIAVLPVMCVYPFFQKYYVKGITVGAVKG